MFIVLMMITNNHSVGRVIQSADSWPSLFQLTSSVSTGLRFGSGVDTQPLANRWFPWLVLPFIHPMVPVRQWFRFANGRGVQVGWGSLHSLKTITPTISRSKLPIVLAGHFSNCLHEPSMSLEVSPIALGLLQLPQGPIQ